LNLEDMILVSVDDHVIEPGNLFDNHLPKKYADRAPKLVYDPAINLQKWTWEGGTTATPFICAVVTLPPMEWGYDPSTLAEMRPGCWDVNQRVRDMDANGVFASMNFPSFTGMAGTFFATAEDKDFAFTCLQAYNDWHIDEWAGSHPGRFIALPLPAIWSPELAAKEARRVARKGVKAISFSEAPESFGYPSIHSGEWDVFFKACVDEGLVVAIHIASSNVAQGANPAASVAGKGPPIEVTSTLPTWNALPCAANLLWSKSLVKFPDLKIALSEGGTSWIPGFLDRMERQFHVQKWARSDLGGLTPTEMFRKHFLACFISDPSGLLLRDRIGVDNIAYEVDYPHSDCTFPGSPEELWEHLVEARCSDAEIDKITHQNAADWFGLDLFRHIPKADATVGALRARARDVDLRIRSKAEYRKAYEETYGAIA
jgi:predicted TIM-barrel fold metal-dependent hydrolase